MKHKLGLLTFACLVLAAPAGAQDGAPIRRIVLSAGGLAHVERAAQVSNNATLTLQVPLAQIDDLLKSLVVLDAKGKVEAVRLVGREPLSQTFKPLPFTHADLATPAALLGALRGAEIEIAGAKPIQGRLLSVAAETRGKPETAAIVHRLSVLTPSGIESAILEDAASVRFADAALRAQVEQALAAVLDKQAQDSRAVEIVLSGAGERMVTLAYVVEAPIWKPAYRLVLPQTGGTARLQGWAVVENMSGGNWTNVELTIVSGQPVTLKQALYESYYVRRPEIPVQVAGRLLPRRDAGAVPAPLAMAAPAFAPRDHAESFGEQGMRLNKTSSARGFDLAGGAYVASAAEAPTQVTFQFPKPVTVPAGQSLTLPFVDAALPIERVWLYQPDVNARHPVAAIKIVNKTGTGLPGGIATIYGDERGAFSGDAEFPVLPTGDARFVAFALDQKTLVDHAERETRARRIVSARNGLIAVDQITIHETVYSIRAPQGEARKLIIEHPRREGWAIEAAAAPETTPTHYRIAVELAPGEAKTVPVRLALSERHQHVLTDLTEDMLAALANDAEPASAAHAKLRQLAELRRALTQAEGRRKDIELAYGEDLQEQERLRANLAAAAKAGQLADAVRKYQQDLAHHDERLARRIEERDTLRKEINTLKEKLRAAVNAFEL